MKMVSSRTATAYFSKLTIGQSRRAASSKSKKGSSAKNVDVPPEPTTCCMAGCANCVWLEYAQQLVKMFNDNGETASRIILDKITDPNMKAFLSSELRSIQARKQKNNNK